MTNIDYSSLERLSGYSTSYLQNLDIHTATFTEGTGSFSLVGYNIGTVEILQTLQTTNVLLCLVLLLLFIITILSGYYFITRILKPYWG